MLADKKNILSDETLQGVSGGLLKKSDEFMQRRTEFENAWNRLKLDSKGFSGMRMAELFDEWEIAGFTPDAASFLSLQLS